MPLYGTHGKREVPDTSDWSPSLALTRVNRALSCMGWLDVLDTWVKVSMVVKVIDTRRSLVESDNRELGVDIHAGY